ncbi:HNH endonuclease [Microbulbifer sp. ALW1]|uniref:HNH endonuclease n=1 Tax=Microbulbifer sp. (strain ALW1) TaxID=1516059 RepID=UPI00135C44DB|nr:HNH endonuclease [Microbulbifer sp. ALW1]
MQIYVENQRGDRYRVSAGWSSAPTIFENDLSAELLASFPTSALDQIFEQFLAKATLSQSLDQAFSGQDLLHTHQYPAAPGHFSDEHRAVYLAVKQHRLLIEEAPHGEGVLDERQTNLRGRIRMGLQKIIAEERAEAARIEAVHSKRSSLEKAGAYVGKFGSALGQGAWDLAVWTKDIAEVAMLVNPIRQQTQMLSATYDYYVHDKSFEQSSKEYLGKVKKELVDVLGFDPSTITAEQLQQAFEVAHLIYDDSALRSDITRFAKDYVKAQHSLEMTEFAGGGVFEIILTIVLAAFTGGVGGVTAMAKNGRLLARFKDVGDLMLDFAKYQKRRNALKKARGAKSEAASFSKFETIEVSAPEAPINQAATQRASPPRGRSSDSNVPSNPKLNPKTRLPRTNGRWDGEPGNGFWHSNIDEVNEITGGKPIEFANGRPVFTPWAKGQVKFKPGQLDGSKADFDAVYEYVAKQKGLSSPNAAKNYLKEAGLTPHHLDNETIQFVPSKLHGNIPHIGSASDLRGGF